MKNLLRFLTLNAIVMAAAISAFAQQPTAAAAPTQADAAAAKVCGDLYTKWRENYKGDANQQKTAYDAGKEYLAKCPNDEYVSYVQKWVPKYEAAVQTVQREQNYIGAVKAGDWRNILTYGKQMAEKDPDNLLIQYNIMVAASILKDKAVYPDSISAARKVLQLIQSGKTDAFTPAQWTDLKVANKGEMAAFVNYLLGFYTYEKSPAEAVGYFVKAAQSEGKYKKEANVYYLLSLAYQSSEYAPMAKDYQDNCAGKDMTDECKVKLDKLNLVVDRIIDALARTTSLTSDAAAKTARMQELEVFYKFRHNNETTGLNDLIAGIQTKPLLLPSMQTLPAPPTAPATNATPTGTASTGTGTVTTPAATNNPTPAPTNAAKPATNTSATNTAKPADASAPKPKP